MRFAPIQIGLCVVLVGIMLSTAGCPRRATLRVDNQSSQNIVVVNSTPVEDDTWGDNLISTPIAPGTARDITGFRPGDYDARVIFADESSQVFFDLVYAAGQTYTLTVEDETLKGELSIPSPVDFAEEYVAPSPDGAYDVK
jgi:hypothetical protein